MAQTAVGQHAGAGSTTRGAAPGSPAFICKGCVAKIAALYEYVLVSDYEAQTEQLQIANAQLLEVLNQLDRVTKQLQSGDLQRLQDELEQTRQERDSFSARANKAERENAQLRSGEAASVLREAITETVAAFAAPATKTKKKAA